MVKKKYHGTSLMWKTKQSEGINYRCMHILDESEGDNAEWKSLSQKVYMTYIYNTYITFLHI